MRFGLLHVPIQLACDGNGVQYGIGLSKDMLPAMGSIGKVVGWFFKFLMDLSGVKDRICNE